MDMKALTAILAFGIFSLFASGLVLAAQPANQACLGEDISGYAQGGSAFGGFISGLASATEGVGDELNAHLAGLVPDEVIPNSCNN